MNCSYCFKWWFARSTSWRQFLPPHNTLMEGDLYGLAWRAYRAGWEAHRKQEKSHVSRHQATP